MVGDPGALHSDWEPGTELNVIKASSRPPFDSRGLATRDLKQFRKVSVYLFEIECSRRF